MSKIDDIRSREDDDLRREVTELEREIWELRFRAGDEKSGDPSRIRQKRRQVARIKTILTERKLGINVAPDAASA